MVYGTPHPGNVRVPRMSKHMLGSKSNGNEWTVNHQQKNLLSRKPLGAAMMNFISLLFFSFFKNPFMYSGEFFCFLFLFLFKTTKKEFLGKKKTLNFFQKFCHPVKDLVHKETNPVCLTVQVSILFLCFFLSFSLSFLCFFD